MIVTQSKFEPVGWGPASVEKPTLERRPRRDKLRGRGQSGAPRSYQHPHLHVLLDQGVPVASCGVYDSKTGGLGPRCRLA